MEKVEEEGRTLARLPTHRRRTLACESCCCWLPCALKFDPAKLPILRVRQTQVYLSKESFLGGTDKVVVICTQSIVWTWGTPRRVLSLSLQGGKVNSGHWTKSGVESRPLRSPNSNSSLFLAGRTDSSQACIRRTDRAQICLALSGQTVCLTSSLPSSLSPGLRDFLRAGGPS